MNPPFFISSTLLYLFLALLESFSPKGEGSFKVSWTQRPTQGINEVGIFNKKKQHEYIQCGVVPSEISQ